LTEPPLNAPENREYTAEIMFETFNVPGLYIAVQAVLALAASWTSKNVKERTLTGTVIDSGDGVTHVIPVAEGYVIGSSIKHIPLAGRDITAFVQQLMRERGEPIPNEDLYLATMEIKEKYGYLCDNLIKELSKFDSRVKNDKGEYVLGSHFKEIEGVGKATGNPYKIQAGYELFMGPEAFFSPEIIDKNYRTPIDELIDGIIQKSSIDYRRKLYSNIVLSGGSTQMKNFEKRLQRDIQRIANERIDKYNKNSESKSEKINVNVSSCLTQRHTVWLGGSIIATSNDFSRMVHTREEYLEKGPSCCRFNAVLSYLNK